MAIEAPAAARALAADADDDGEELRTAPLPGEPEAVEGLAPESIPLLERLFLRKLRKGDPRAFRELVRRHQDRVYSMCLRMLGQHQEAEDISQEVFVAVHRHLPRFRGECKLSTWIYRVAKNQCLNRIKYNDRRETEGPDALETMTPAEAHGFLSTIERPDRATLGAEERAHVQLALCQLSPDHRLILVLRDIEGMAYEEIARIADLPPGTVKSRLHRARAALADVLEAAGMAPDPQAGR